MRQLLMDKFARLQTHDVTPSPPMKRSRPSSRLETLPPELLQYIVGIIPFAGQMARKAPTCRALSVAVRNAFKVRPFSSEVVTLAGHNLAVPCVAVPDGRIITGSYDRTIRVWRAGAC